MTEQLTAAPDTLLAGRYRLQKVAGPGTCTTTWRGLDEVLARPVAVKVLDHPDRVPGGSAAFLDAAVAAGRLTHPRIASVFDAAEEGGLTYVVSEWVEGRPLAAILATDGPLPAPRATTVAAQVAETVAYAHSRGVFHLALDAHNVLVCGDGSVKVTDFEIGAAGRAAGAPAPEQSLPNELRDTRAVAALLYACLTGRSVHGTEPELQRAPYRDGHLCAPRQVRAGVPREVDGVVVRTLLPDLAKKAAPITTAAGLVAELAPLPGEGPHQRTFDDDLDERPPRRWLRYGVPSLVVAGVAVAGVLLGIAVGTVPPPISKLPGLDQQPSAQPAENARPGTPIAPVAVSDFDPLGDGAENPNEVSLAYNGDTTDAWHTTVYYNTPTFGNLKAGVGLLVDFGKPTAFNRVLVAFAEPGESVEIRAGNQKVNDPAAFPVVASASDVKVPLTVRPQGGTTARYWLVWITKLVPAGEGRYAAAVAELGFYR